MSKIATIRGVSPMHNGALLTIIGVLGMGVLFPDDRWWRVGGVGCAGGGGGGVRGWDTR